MNKVLNILGLPSTVVGSKEWNELENREFTIGPDALLDEILEKRQWTNVEIAWVLKRMIYFYGKKDSLLLKAPPERIFLNLVDILRAFYLLVDLINPDLDDNMRSYICSKLADATWGINSRTREYLQKF
ncbi:MAG: hypothetical protein GX790_04760 [Syntrophomonadaceae bacterium]|nr:hypothetical protein [Syntrophomonadaceae bacterium]